MEWVIGVGRAELSALTGRRRRNAVVLGMVVLTTADLAVADCSSPLRLAPGPTWATGSWSYVQFRSLLWRITHHTSTSKAPRVTAITATSRRPMVCQAAPERTLATAPAHPISGGLMRRNPGVQKVRRKDAGDASQAWAHCYRATGVCNGENEDGDRGGRCLRIGDAESCGLGTACARGARSLPFSISYDCA